MNKLHEILEHKRAEIDEKKKSTSIDMLRSEAATRPAPPYFRAGLGGGRIGLIAEIKRKSPGAGEIRADLLPANLAEAYADAGAHAISILADERFFGGKESDFINSGDVVDRPILYKEFIVDPWQIWHASALGASAVLLIVAALDDNTLMELVNEAARARMASLLEVHTAEEMKRVRTLTAPLIGINNRNIDTLDVDPDNTFRLLDKVPEGSTVISESGIRTPEQVLKLQQAGVDGILVGEHLLRQDDVGQAIKELMGMAWASS